ncbi:MAG TPA: hypothetical protein V6C96_02580, partial [Vampirovibrionales bacterium]
NATTGDFSAARTERGDVKVGSFSAVRTTKGTVTIGNNSVGMGTKIGAMGINSVVALVDDRGGIVEIVVKTNNAQNIKLTIEEENK